MSNINLVHVDYMMCHSVQGVQVDVRVELHLFPLFFCHVHVFSFQFVNTNLCYFVIMYLYIWFVSMCLCCTRPNKYYFVYKNKKKTLFSNNQCNNRGCHPSLASGMYRHP